MTLSLKEPLHSTNFESKVGIQNKAGARAGIDAVEWATPPVSTFIKDAAAWKLEEDNVLCAE
jgi:hypothetical protein